MKAFVDANTILSGLLFAGNDAILLELGRLGAVCLITNQYVLGEVRKVLKRKEFRLAEEEQLRLMRYVMECISIVGDPKAEEIRKHYDLLRDRKDLPVVVGVKKEGCDYLITGDKELLSEKVKRFANSITTSELLGALIEEKFLKL
ncbi:MAG: putative toxin-antitoxin system toxin component, PIN family [Candidatus Verstraetearchaeota archaeon]|nr:putative toxin-antitoxin system toxin component, PIN family [Candidatus Verstraetearchaeota archaeon]